MNTLLTTQYFYRAGLTSLPSPFVATSTWFGLSVLPLLHTCWQAQLLLLGVLLVGLILLKMDYQHEATEEAFLSTLICCIVAIAPTIFFTGIMILWGYLIAKRQMTWRVWMASLIAIALRIFVMVGLRYTGWLQWMWIENLPRLAWQEWLIGIGIVVTTFAAILLPMRKASVGTGLFYLIYLIALLTAGSVLTYGGFF
jgi:hypothetical protein